MDMLEGINLSLLIPLLVVELILVIVALADLFRAERANGPKWIWALVILFISLLGPIAYFVFGRRND